MKNGGFALYNCISVAVFDMGAKVNCRTDYVQLIENNSQGEETVKRQFCGGVSICDTVDLYQ